MFPTNRQSHGAGPSTSSAAPQPLSDDEARSQVVDAAKTVVAAANLTVTDATFSWEWCNDQGDPPYHGRVDLAFKIPPEVTDKAALFKQIAAQAAKQPGWAPGPPPGLNPYGDVAHIGGVMAVVAPGNYPENGRVRVFGECRNMTDHRKDNKRSDVIDELRPS